MNKELRIFLLEQGLKMDTRDPETITLTYQERTETFAYPHEGMFTDVLAPVLDLFAETPRPTQKLRTLFGSDYSLIEKMR